ncbi:MAG: hypothetical protein AAB011_11825 [Candidatus Eisenbacteria bacterium]
MAGSFKTAGVCANAALRSFSVGEFAPLLTILAAQWLFLIGGLNLGSTWGMALAGSVAQRLVGDAAIDYPGFLELLPLTFSYVESVTFIVLGAMALPSLTSRVLVRLKPSLGDSPTWAGRVRSAIVPTFLALLMAFVLTYVWQLFVAQNLHRIVGALVQGQVPSSVVTWLVSVAIGYAITTIFIYVPVVAVSQSIGAIKAVRLGVTEGFDKFPTTYLFVLLLSLPALAIQLIVQIGGPLIASGTRPENIAYLLIFYALVSTVATYFVWNMVTRYYHARTEAA